MKHSRLAGIGTLIFLLIAALFVACSSDDEQTDQQQSSPATGSSSSEQAQSQADQSQSAQQQESAASTTRTSQVDADEEDSAATTTTESEGQQSEPQTTVSTTATQEDEEQSQAVNSESDQQQAQDQPAQQAEPAQEQADEEPAQQTQPEQSDEQGPAQQQPAQTEGQQESAAATTATAEVEETDQQEQLHQSSEPGEAERLQLRAEEIRAQATVTDVTGLNGWLNGAETTIALELAKGNVVLIDFWTYTCINCVRTLPFLTAWDQKYRDHGLVIIGVHTPEFEFEERIENVRAAIAEHNIEYLVAIDNDYRTWRAFQNRWWPRKFMIGPTDASSPMGIRYDHIGEGDYDGTELQIRAALEAVGRDLSDVPFGVDVAVPTRQTGAPRQTRELYAGWRRNVGSGGPYAGQESYFLAGTGIDTLYYDIDTSDRQHNLWYLEGLWRTENEAIVHARNTEELEDYIALLVRGRTANVVLTVAEDGQPFNVYVELDGRWLFPNEAGEHVQWDDQDRSYIRVTENDLYRLINLPEWSEHELKLRSDSDQFRIFAFTFGSYVGGE